MTASETPGKEKKLNGSRTPGAEGTGEEKQAKLSSRQGQCQGKALEGQQGAAQVRGGWGPSKGPQVWVGVSGGLREATATLLSLRPEGGRAIHSQLHWGTCHLEGSTTPSQLGLLSAWKERSKPPSQARSHCMNAFKVSLLRVLRAPPTSYPGITLCWKLTLATRLFRDLEASPIRCSVSRSLLYSIWFIVPFSQLLKSI